MFDKFEDKDVRVPIKGKVNENSKAIRPSLHRNLKMDSTFYEAQEPKMKHMKINNLDGEGGQKSFVNIVKGEAPDGSRFLKSAVGRRQIGHI